MSITAGEIPRMHRFRSHLTDDDPVLWSGAPQRETLKKRVLMRLLLALGLIGVFSVPFIIGTRIEWLLIPVLILALSFEVWIGAALAVLWEAGQVFGMRLEAYVLTDTRLLVGLSTTKVRVIEISDIRNTIASKNPVGDVDIHFSGRLPLHARTVVLRAVEGPTQVKTLIDRQIARSQDAG